MNTETKVVAQKNLMVSLSIVLVAFYDKQVAPRLNHLRTVTLPYLGSGLQARWTHLKTKTAPWIGNGIRAFFHWTWYTARPNTVWGIGVALCWVWYTAFPAIGNAAKTGYKWTAPKVYNCQIGSRIRLVSMLRWLAKKIDPVQPAQAILLTPKTPSKAKSKAKKPLTLTTTKKPAKKKPSKPVTVPTAEPQNV